MNEEQHDVHAPDLRGEEMKMPETANTTPQATAPSASPLGGIIIVILVFLLIVILGGLYLWFAELMNGSRSTPTTPTLPAIERPTAEENNEPESTTAEAAVETQAALSTSDEIAAIEADIEATDLDSLDAELNAIDAELEAAISGLESL